jgi:hypothetical protein
MQDQAEPKTRPIGLFGFLARLKWIMVTISLVGLLASNIAAVLSAGFHDRLYAGLRKVLLIAGESVADSVTRGSKSVEVDRKVREQTTELRTQAADSETRRARAEAELDGERAKLKRTQLDLDDARAKRLIDAKEAKKVASGVRDRLARGVTRNVGAIPAESVPYLGVGVALSMVGLDLYDACETMKEVNGLLVKLGQGVEDDAFCGMKVPTRDQVLADLNSTWRTSYEKARGEVEKAKGQVRLPQLQMPGAAEVRAVVCPVASWIPGC